MTAQCLSESIGRNTVPWGRQVLAGPRIYRESGLAAAGRTEDFAFAQGTVLLDAPGGEPQAKASSPSSTSS